MIPLYIEIDFTLIHSDGHETTITEMIERPLVLARCKAMTEVHKVSNCTAHHNKQFICGYLNP